VICKGYAAINCLIPVKFDWSCNNIKLNLDWFFESEFHNVAHLTLNVTAALIPEQFNTAKTRVALILERKCV
jgi:hypothetical protein